MKPPDWDAVGRQLREQLINDPEGLPEVLNEAQVFRLLRVMPDELEQLIRERRLRLTGGRMYLKQDVRALLIEKEARVVIRTQVAEGD